LYGALTYFAHDERKAQTMKDILSPLRTSFRLKIVSMLGLTVLADFLFYGHKLGWTIGFFGLLLAAICVLHNSHILKSTLGQIIFGLTIGQCFLQIEKVSLLCLGLMFIGIVSLTILSQSDWKQDASLWFRKVLFAVCRIFAPLNKAMRGYQKYRSKYAPPNNFMLLLRGWFLPVVLSCVFIALFSSANPIITKWFSGINLIAILRGFSPWRMMFWFVIAVTVFSVIRPKLKPLGKKLAAVPNTDKPMSFSEWAFTKEAVLRSLIIFNLLFAFQTAMDMNYLWAGGELPAGISYAQYAQKGAYPLIITALLAAMFVLVSQNAGQEVSGSKPVRALIYAWVMQNILLVISSIYRTGLYVEVYALTYWRVAAFIWMGLVACGLAWIIVRSVLGKSNTWLINANVITLLAVLYITSFVNIGGMIAQYNVTHSREVSGEGVQLDHGYIQRIGASAIPAMMQYVEIMGQKFPSDFNHNSVMTLDAMKHRLKWNMDDWRRRTYSEYRQLNALESNAQ
jgi:Domain of unknown function (DUF4173)